MAVSRTWLAGAEILAQVDEQLAQARPGLGRLPVRPQEGAKVIMADRLAVGQGKAGQQSSTLARTDCNRIACHSLKFGRAKKMEPVTRHDLIQGRLLGPVVKAN